jgi:hypothetical protein
MEKRAIDVGENNEKFIEIKSGLKEGDQVALDARARMAAEAKAAEASQPPEQPKAEAAKALPSPGPVGR